MLLPAARSLVMSVGMLEKSLSKLFLNEAKISPLGKDLILQKTKFLHHATLARPREMVLDESIEGSTLECIQQD